MSQSIAIAPPNSLIFIMDYLAGDIPDAINDALVSSAASCIAVGTLAEFDGATTVTLASAMQDVAHLTNVFNGVLDTPSRQLSICNVKIEVLLFLAGLTERTNVQVFANDLSEPDQILVVASSV
ncbi:hypothetical protein [Lysobacter capsici]|uniref:hypothetical protein n=1 Tax=Lysobacter capsici TaxID=435897 RepID=UPI001290768C|nr:hypothetical protein [Lysobacter capsici]